MKSAVGSRSRVTEIDCTNCTIRKPVTHTSKNGKSRVYAHQCPMPPRKKAPAPANPLPAQGKGQKKRTPQSAFDPAAGNDIYEPEKVVAQRIAKGGITQYHTKWVGYESKHNTWEPIENLAGYEDMIADFNEREKQRLAELDAAAAAKRAEKEEAAAKLAADKAAAATAARVAAAAQPNPFPQSNEEAHGAAAQPAVKKEVGAKRTAPVWTAFCEQGCAAGHAACNLLTPLGQVCGDVIGCAHGPTPLWTHLMYKHKADYILSLIHI
eukprot:2730228-Prymnesium_polylepis.1